MPGTQETLDTDYAHDDEVFEDDEELEQLATKRAGLTDRYNYHREELRTRAPDQSVDTTDDTSHWRERLAAQSETLADTLERWRERLTAHQRTITDIETRPEVAATSLQDAQASAENIEVVRFEFDNGEGYSEWYTWEPKNPAHPLNKLIDYYADGDLSQLYYTTVDVTATRWSDDTHYVLFPEPYSKRTAHLHYRFLQPFMYADRPDESDDGFRHSVENLTGNTVTAETTHSIEVGRTGAQTVGDIAAFVSLAGVLVAILGGILATTVGAPSAVAAHTPALSGLEILIPALAVGIALFIGGFGSVLLAKTAFTRTRHDFTADAYAAGLVAWIFLLGGAILIPLFGPLVLGGRWLKRRAKQAFDRVNTHNPY